MICCTTTASDPPRPVPTIRLSRLAGRHHGLHWMTKTQRNYNGPVLALSSAFLFGASTPIAKLLLGNTDPLLLAGLLYLGSGAGLALVVTGGRLLGLGRSEAPLRARDLAWLGTIGLFGGILGPALLMWGLTLTSASTGALLLNTEGLATMAIAWVVFRENVDRRIFLPRRDGDPCWRAPALLAGSGGDRPATQLGQRTDRPRLRLLGDRQQSHPQAQRRRSVADRHDQRFGGRRGQSRAGAHRRGAVAGTQNGRRRGGGWLLRLRDQLGPLCVGSSALGSCAHRRLLLDGSLYWCSPGASAVWRDTDLYSDGRGAADGHWRLSAPRRGARPRASA